MKTKMDVQAEWNADGTLAYVDVIYTFADGQKKSCTCEVKDPHVGHLGHRHGPDELTTAKVYDEKKKDFDDDKLLAFEKKNCLETRRKQFEDARAPPTKAEERGKGKALD